jgi:hypothetical protein
MPRSKEKAQPLGRARLLTCRTSGSQPKEETVGGSLGKKGEHGGGVARVERWIHLGAPDLVDISSEL